jgi:serine/threonine protein kinase
MDSPLRVGEFVAGKYEIEGVVGAGGMGVVLAARHRRLGHRVAIKFLSDDLRSSQASVARFERESRVLAALKSDHVARIYDVGELDNGTPYIVMEFLEGEDLAHVLTRGPLPVAEAIEWVAQACVAMAEAHHSGIIHRDLKPSNIFLARRPDGSRLAKVLDFGVSKTAIVAGSAALTKTAALMGSPYYMSPEQIREARDVDSRTDVWALGATLYELLVGRPPFVSQAVGELCSMILTQAPEPPHLRRTEISIETSRIVLRCLEKDPGDRFASADTLAMALRQNLGNVRPGPVLPPVADTWVARPTSDVFSPPSGGTQAVSTDAPITRTPPPPPRRLRRRAYALAAAAMAIGALGLGARSLWPRPPQAVAERSAAAVPTAVTERSEPRPIATTQNEPATVATTRNEPATVATSRKADELPLRERDAGSTTPHVLAPSNPPSAPRPGHGAPASSRDLLDNHY